MPKIMFRPAPTPPPFVPPTPVAGALTFTAREANSSVAFNIEGSVMGVSLSYSIDNGQTWNLYTFGQSVNLAAVGDNVMFKGDNDSFSVNEENFIQAAMTGKIAASGSLAYVLDSNGGIKALTPYCFIYMFSDCTSLVHAPALPATSLADGCYQSMFNGCSSLVQAPALPATILADYCYESMFDGCSSLVQAPILHAASLAKHCYSFMFNGCSSLEQAPALPATSLFDYCYYNMFRACSSMVQAPSLPANSLVDSCYNNMFNGCTSLKYVQCNATDISANGCLTFWLLSVSDTGTFKKNSSMNDWPSGASGIPDGWTVENI